MKNLFIIFVLLFPVITQAQTLQGKINFTDEYRRIVYLSKIDHIDQLFITSPHFIIDSADIDSDGNFRFRRLSLPNEERFYRLSVSKNNAPSASLDMTGGSNYIILTLNNKSKEFVTADLNDFAGTYQVKLSNNISNKKIRNLQIEFENELEKIEKYYIDKLQDATAKAIALNDSVNAATIAYAIRLRRAVSFEPMEYIYLLAELKHISDVIQKPEIIGLMNGSAVMIDYFNGYSDHTYSIQIKDYLAEKMNVQPGKQTPELVLKNLDGKEVDLSSLNGKIVLVDFWATWCRACVKDHNDVLIPLYNKYADKGFEIYAVSVDKEINKLNAYLEEKSIPWINTHVNQEKLNLIKYDFWVNYYPTYWLIDAEGKIIATHFRGSELAELLEKYLGK